MAGKKHVRKLIIFYLLKETKNVYFCIRKRIKENKEE